MRGTWGRQGRREPSVLENKALAEEGRRRQDWTRMFRGTHTLRQRAARVSRSDVRAWFLISTYR